jgi:hypothetical protein
MKNSSKHAMSSWSSEVYVLLFRLKSALPDIDSEKEEL